MLGEQALPPVGARSFLAEAPGAGSARRLGRAGAAFTRLNESYVRICLVGLAVSAVLHALYILFGPGPASKPYQLRERRIQVIDIPDEIDVPPPPPEVERPPLPETPQLPKEPEIVETPKDEEETLPETTFDPLAPPVAPEAAGEEFVAFDSPPEPTRRVTPVYPELAREVHAEGVVHVQVTIDERGQVIEAVILKSDAIGSLEEAALEAARAWRFRPAKQRDVPVKARIVLPFRFRLSRGGEGDGRLRRD